MNMSWRRTVANLLSVISTLLMLFLLENLYIVALDKPKVARMTAVFTFTIAVGASCLNAYLISRAKRAERVWKISLCVSILTCLVAFIWGMLLW